MTAAEPRPDRPAPDRERHARAKELFLQALRLPADRREGWLDGACAGQAGLADEVRSLLAQHTAATLLAPGSPTAVVATPGPAAGTEPLRLHKRLADREDPARRRRLALGLLLGAVLLLAGALAVQRSAERSLRALLERQLVALLDTGERALRTWLAGELHLVREFAGSDRVRALASELARIADAPDAEAALAAPPAQAAQATLADLLAPMARRGGHRGFALVDRAGRLLAFSSPDLEPGELRAGMSISAASRDELAQVLSGGARLRLPYRRGTALEDSVSPAGESVLAVMAPVRDEAGEPRAALAFLLRAEDDFGSLLAAARTGDGGDTFAFDREGRLLSESRHTEEFAAAGLLPAGGPPGSSLHMPLRDPGVDLRAGARPAGDPSTWPLTRMAADATAGGRGVDVAGYRDALGVEVVGAWCWLDEHGFGIAAEVPASEAYAALALPRLAVGGLLVLAAGSLVLAVAASLRAARLRREVQLERRLGQYELEEVIGQGGSGQVWRARHGLLQRPTAVKLLRPDALSPAALQQLEREVRITARLTHPNTIEVYDCGFTEDGQFFYAMELLEGCSLQRLVQDHGAQPVPRAVHILRQMCASLAEAHAVGLVHRDIKPGNTMLCRLGGELDVVKVLDFGLVKDLAAPVGETAATVALSGTPLYMSPERLRPGVPADPRCDVWAVGATAFKLLAGRDLWSGSMADVFVQILSQRAPRVASHAQVPAELDALVAECLQPDPARRPADAGALLSRLEALPVPPWTQASARAWWKERAPATMPPPPAGAAHGG